MLLPPPVVVVSVAAALPSVGTSFSPWVLLTLPRPSLQVRGPLGPAEEHGGLVPGAREGGPRRTTGGERGLPQPRLGEPPGLPGQETPPTLRSGVLAVAASGVRFLSEAGVVFLRVVLSSLVVAAVPLLVRPLWVRVVAVKSA